MAISTSFHFPPVQTKVPFAERPLAVGASFHDHFVRSESSELVLGRPTFQVQSTTLPKPELKLAPWQATLANLNFGQAANDPSWVTELKEFQRECYYCDGTGKCQHDDRPGSGKINGEDDFEFCNGTGKCEHCGGDGDMGN